MNATAATLPEDWDIVTCEYPPTIGGVSDYSFTLASELAATGPVHVWCPATAGAVPERRNVTVHRLRSFSRRELRTVGDQLDARPGRRRLFVQWVPQGFGYRSLNLGFALWVAQRGWRGDQVHLMVHEPFLPWSMRPRHLAAALVHRAMLATAAATATRVWVSTFTWRDVIRGYVRRAIPIDWLPVPAPVLPDAAADGMAFQGEATVGHFGTHSPLVLQVLAPALDEVLRRTRARVLLIGRDSDAFRQAFVRSRPAAEGRVHATGALPPDQVAARVRGCDVMLQPYPDGITTRRTSAVTLLSLGLPIVTNRGHLTEDFWPASGAVRLAPTPDASEIAAAVVSLLDDAGARTRLGARAREMYDDRFASRHAVALLNAAAGPQHHAA